LCTPVLMHQARPTPLRSSAEFLACHLLVSCPSPCLAFSILGTALNVGAPIEAAASASGSGSAGRTGSVAWGRAQPRLVVGGSWDVGGWVVGVRVRVMIRGWGVERCQSTSPTSSSLHTNTRHHTTHN